MEKETELLIEFFLENENYQESTKKAYKGTLFKLFNFIPLNEFQSLETLGECIESIFECFKGSKDKTLNETFNRIRIFMNTLTTPSYVDWNKLKYNFNDTTAIKSLSDKEIEMIKDYLKPFDSRLLATFLLINNLPLRREEISQITPADFLSDKPSIVILGKNNKRRDIFVVSNEVIQFIKENNIENFVNPRLLYDKLKEAEIYIAQLTGDKTTLVNYNILRHTFITRMIDNGFSLPRLARLSGHSVVTLFDNYYANNFTKSKEEYESIVNTKVNFRTDKLYIKYLEQSVRDLKKDIEIVELEKELIQIAELTKETIKF